MLAAAIINAREGMEAALALGVLIAYLSRTGRQAFIRYILWGAAAAIVASVGVALLLGQAFMAFGEAFEALAGLAAVAIITYVIFWMSAKSRELAANIESRAERLLSSRQVFGLSFLAFILILREGVETAIFTMNLSSTHLPSHLLAGAVAGWGAVFIAAWLLYRGLYRFDVRKFFFYTSLILIVFAAGILGKATMELQAVGWLPGTIAAWDTSWLTVETSAVGGLLSALLGYTAAPTVLQVIFYFSYLALILYFWLGTRLPANGSLPYGEPFRAIGSGYTHPLYRLLRNRWLPLVPFVIMTILFLLLLVAAIFPISIGPFSNSGAMQLSRFSTAELGNNLFNFVMWIVWLPLLTVSAIFVGRLWCGNLCPLRWISDLSRSLADKLFKPIARAKPYRGIEWILPSTFVLITLFVRVYPIQRVALYGALLLLGLTVAAIVISMLFRQGTWCRYVCPIGGWLARAARLSVLGLRPRSDVCATCEDKPCLHASKLAGGCPAFLNPSKLESSRHCLDCWNCVKNCPLEKSALKLGLRAPGAELMKPYSPRLGEAVFVAALIGMYVASARQGVVLGSLPYPLAFFTLMALSVVAYFALCGLVTLLGGIPFRDALTKIGYVFLPLEFGTAVIAFGDETLEFLGIVVPAASFLLGVTFIWSLLLAASILQHNTRRPAMMWRSFVPVAASLMLVLLLWLNWYASGVVIDLT